MKQYICIDNSLIEVTVLDSSKNPGIQKKHWKIVRELGTHLGKWDAILLRKKDSPLKHLKNCKISLSMTLCGKGKIQTLNHQFRNKNKVTDVLSFALFPDLRKINQSETGPFIELGDVFICKERAETQAKTYKITYREEVIHLFVHGLLHLLGFDHEISSQEEKIMEEWEEKLLQQVGIKG